MIFNLTVGAVVVACVSAAMYGLCSWLFTTAMVHEELRAYMYKASKCTTTHELDILYISLSEFVHDRCRSHDECGHAEIVANFIKSRKNVIRSGRRL